MKSSIQNRGDIDRQPKNRTRKELALERCDQQIQWYEDAMKRSGKAYNWSQGLAICLGGLTPILVVLLSILQEYQGVLMILIALFPALAAIITGLNGVYQWKEDLIRFGYTSEILKSEKIRFSTRTTEPYKENLSETEALDNFVRRIESIVLKETADWRSQVSNTMELDEALKLVNETRSSLLSAALDGSRNTSNQD